MDSEQLAVPSVPIDGFRCLLGSARNGDDGKQNLKLWPSQDVRAATGEVGALLLFLPTSGAPRAEPSRDPPPSRPGGLHWRLLLLHTRSGGSGRSSDKAVMRSGREESGGRNTTVARCIFR